MQYIILILLVFFIAYLVVRLRKRDAQLLEMQTELHEQQAKTEQAIRMVGEASAMKKEIQDHINTIHLYASLSEEESRSTSVKEKQQNIMQLSEKILHQIQK